MPTNLENMPEGFQALDANSHPYPFRVSDHCWMHIYYVTPAVKMMLRRKNRLMRAGRTEDAGALAGHIRIVITRNSAKWLRKVDTKKSPSYAWEKVAKSYEALGNLLDKSKA